MTGLAARIVAKHPDLTPFEHKAVLTALAAKVAQADTRSPRPGDRADSGSATPARPASVSLRQPSSDMSNSGVASLP